MKIVLTKTKLIFILLTFFSSCASFKNKSLSSSEVVDDLYKIRNLIIQVNPYQDVIPKQLNEGLHFLSEKIKKYEANKISVSRDDFCQEIEELFTIIPDNHSRFNCSSQSVPSISHSLLSLEPWILEDALINGEKGLHLEIRQFLSFSSPKWEPLKKTLSERLKRAQFIVIDLTKHSGGDNNPALFIAKTLWGSKIPKNVDRIQIQTPESLRIYAQRFQLAHDQKLYQEYWKKYQLALKGKIPLYEIIQKKEFEQEKASAPSPRMYKHPIILLSNSQNGSAGEELLNALRSHPYVTIVGENSSGAYHFGNAGVDILPHSQIEIWLSTMYKKLRDGQFIEKLGFPADINIPKNEKAWGWTLKNWTKLKKSYH